MEGAHWIVKMGYLPEGGVLWGMGAKFPPKTCVIGYIYLCMKNNMRVGRCTKKIFNLLKRSSETGKSRARLLVFGGGKVS